MYAHEEKKKTVEGFLAETVRVEVLYRSIDRSVYVYHN